jgi:hypothetical protein
MGEILNSRVSPIRCSSLILIKLTDNESVVKSLNSFVFLMRVYNFFSLDIIDGTIIYVSIKFTDNILIEGIVMNECERYTYEDEGTIEFGSETEGTIEFGSETKGTIEFGGEIEGTIEFGSEIEGTIEFGSEIEGTIDFEEKYLTF